MPESKPVNATALAAELAAEVLERPKHLEQWDRSLVAVVIIAAHSRPGLVERAAAMVRGIVEDVDGELSEVEPTPSGHWRPRRAA